MSDVQAGGEPAAEAGEAQRPQIQINAQYIKDLSFENPSAPQSLFDEEPPQVDVSVDVGAQTFGDDRYEVELRITARANRGEDRLFIAEVIYAGVFTLINVDEAAVRPVCLIECPRMLFPFARRVIADVTRDGGFPPLMLDPIDFTALLINAQEDAGQDGAAGEAAQGPTA